MTGSIKHRILTILACLVVTIGCGQPKKTGHAERARPVPDSATKFQLLTYGGPPDPLEDRARDVIARKWNITYRSVAGCVVTDSLVNSVNRQNTQTAKLIAEKHGQNWQTTFRKEVAAELAKQRTLTSPANR